MKEAILISQTEKEQQQATDSFICKNDSCRRSFSKPLRVSNLKQKAIIPYYACPYCLTEITFDERQASNAQTAASKVLETICKSSSCKHYMGYLCERPVKEVIPDECMLCGVLVQCMLEKTKK